MTASQPCEVTLKEVLKGESPAGTLWPGLQVASADKPAGKLMEKFILGL
jgi:hypothetical protein